MILEMLVGGGLTITGGAIGFTFGRISIRREPTSPASPASPVKPICGCTHALAFHDPKTHECSGKVSVASKYDQWGDVIAWKKEQCTCRQYDGPTPLPTYYAPEIATTGEAE